MVSVEPFMLSVEPFMLSFEAFSYLTRTLSYHKEQIHNAFNGEKDSSSIVGGTNVICLHVPP